MEKCREEVGARESRKLPRDNLPKGESTNLFKVKTQRFTLHGIFVLTTYIRRTTEGNQTTLRIVSGFLGIVISRTTFSFSS